QRDLHAQARIAHQGGDVQVGIEDLDLAVRVDVTSLDLTLAGCLDVDRLRSVAVQLGDDALDVQHDLGHVFLDARDGGELMLYARDLDAGRCRTGQRGQQDAAQGGAQSGAIATLEGLHNEFTVGAGRGERTLVKR